MNFPIRKKKQVPSPTGEPLPPVGNLIHHTLTGGKKKKPTALSTTQIIFFNHCITLDV